MQHAGEDGYPLSPASAPPALRAPPPSLGARTQTLEDSRALKSGF